MKKPAMLRRGSRVAVVSPSWGGPALYPGVFEWGLKNLKYQMNLEMVEFPTCRMSPDYLYRNPRLRAEDINRAFADPSIDAVFASIGGSDSIRILEFLDIDTILANPKLIMGFSDTTNLLTYLNYRGLVTFHGPSVMAGWAQMHNFPFLREYYSSILFSNNPGQEVVPFSLWSSGYPPWGKKKNQGRVFNLGLNEQGFHWLQKGPTRWGRLWGGCIEVLDWLKGTPYWPDSSFWEDRILIFETSEEKPSPEQVGYSLRNLGIQGVLQRSAGLFFGRARDYSDHETAKLYEQILQVVRGEFELFDLPIVANMDFGHTDPNLILPLGIETVIDPEQESIRFIEPFFLPEE